MIKQDEEQDIVEEVHAPRSGATAVIALSIALGVVLLVGVFGVYWHLQTSDSMQAEANSVRGKLKEKDVALDDMKAQIEALSRQMHALRQHSVARSGSAPAKDAKVPEVPSVLQAAPASDAAPVAEEPSVREKKATSADAKKKTKRPAATCDLAGKSPEEQAATLKRCVELIDAR